MRLLVLLFGLGLVLFGLHACGEQTQDTNAAKEVQRKSKGAIENTEAFLTEQQRLYKAEAEQQFEALENEISRLESEVDNTSTDVQASLEEQRSTLRKKRKEWEKEWEKTKVNTRADWEKTKVELDDWLKKTDEELGTAINILRKGLEDQ